MGQPQPQPAFETKRGRARAKKKKPEPWELILEEVEGQGDISEGDDDEEVYYMPGKKLKHMTEFLPAPFLDETLNLHAAFPRHILYQPTAVHLLANFIRGLRLPVSERSRSESRGAHVGDRIHRYILSGPSGVGKTESVYMVRHYMGMDPGWMYEKQFIYVDGSLLKEGTQGTRLIGAGPGYIGHDSKNCLVNELLDAVVPPVEYILSRLNRSTKLYKRKCLEYLERRKSGVALEPPFILLFIDEIDKVHPDVVTMLNGFLETGEIKSSRGERFVLPLATELLIFFTSNYGDEQIAKFQFHDIHSGEQAVVAAMKRQGLAQCSVSRFGSHLIYFPISEERMTAIIRGRVGTFMQRERLLTTKYGDIDYQSALECVAQFIRKVTNDTKSVREGLKHIFNSLDPLLQEAFFRLEGVDADTFKQDVSAKLGKDDRALKLFQESFRLETLETEAPTTEIVRSIQSNPLNTANLEIYRHQAPDTMIQAFGLSHGDRIINCVIVPFIVNQCTVIKKYDSAQSHEIITELRTEVAELRRDYRELASAVLTITDHHSLEPLRRMASHGLEMHGRVDESGSDDEEEARPPPKRKALSLLAHSEPLKRSKRVDPPEPRVEEMPIGPEPPILEEPLPLPAIPVPLMEVIPPLPAVPAPLPNESVSLEQMEVLEEKMEGLAGKQPITTLHPLFQSPTEEDPSVEIYTTEEEDDENDDDYEDEDEDDHHSNDKLTRVCRSCGIEKDRGEFIKKRMGRRKKDGTRSVTFSSCRQCEPCRRKRHSTWRKK